MMLTPTASYRAIERALQAALRAPFNAPAHPVYRAYVREVLPALDPSVKGEFLDLYARAREQFHNDAAAIGWLLAWCYDHLRQGDDDDGVQFRPDASD